MKTPTIEEIKGVIDDYILLFEELVSKAKILEGVSKLTGSKLPREFKQRKEQLKLFLGFYTFRQYLETGEMPESLDPVMEVINNLKESINHA